MYIALPLLAFLLCTVLHLCALKLFPKFGLLDFPERYGHKRAPIPYPTGILMLCTFVPLYLLIVGIQKQSIGVCIGVLLLGAISFYDDRKQISPVFRLAAQCLCAFIIFGLGTRIYSITNPFVTNGIVKLDTWVIPFSLFNNPPVLSGIFTIVWLGLTMNALNWFDGIPGQVSTLSFLGFLTIGLLTLSSRITHADPIAQLQLGQVAFTLAGISFAGLLFDFPPNKVLMGDTGAMFLGLMLGVLTIYSGGKVATAFLVLGVPLLDLGIVVARRLYRKKSPLSGNAHDEHLHHRLLLKGWNHRHIIIVTATLGLLFGISALFLSTREKVMAALVLLAIMFGLSVYSSSKK